MSDRLEKQSREVWRRVKQRDAEEELNNQRILELAQQRQRERELDEREPNRFHELLFNWNVDGTLDTLTKLQPNGSVTNFHFAWNIDGTLHKVIRE